MNIGKFLGESNIMKDIETKSTELIQFIKTVGAPHIWSTYNFYLKEIGCPDLIPEGGTNEKIHNRS